MSVFEKILVPLDGSEHSLHALEKALQIANKFDGKITLINVYSVSSFRLTPSQLYPFILKIRASGESILAEGKKMVLTRGIQVESRLKEGHAVEEILKTTRDGNFDLIVMGARGISNLKEIFLGSVSHGVTTHAPCPVLVVK